MVAGHLPHVRQAVARVARRDRLGREAGVRRIVVGDDLSLGADRAGEELGVVAARREDVDHVHPGGDARELEHLLRLAARILLQVGLRAVGTGDGGRDRGLRRLARARLRAAAGSARTQDSGPGQW